MHVTTAYLSIYVGTSTYTYIYNEQSVCTYVRYEEGRVFYNVMLCYVWSRTCQHHTYPFFSSIKKERKGSSTLLAYLLTCFLIYIYIYYLMTRRYATLRYAT